MKSSWAAIDALQNKLKTIQQWNGMQAIIENMQQKIIPFKQEVDAKILGYIKELDANPQKCDDVHNKFFATLTSIFTKHCEAALCEFDRQAFNEFDRVIKEVRKMFATEKLSLETKWLQKEREYKEATFSD